MGRLNTTKLIRAMARTMSAEHAEDLAQVGELTLHRASRTWDPETGACLWTYARLSVRRDMLRYLKAQRWDPSRPGEISYDAINKIGAGASESSCGRYAVSEHAQHPPPFGNVSEDTPETLAIEKERRRALPLFDLLDARSRHVVTLRLQGQDVRSIGMELGLPKSTVDGIYHRAIAHVAACLGVTPCLT